MKTVTYEGIKFPEPKFAVDLEELLKAVRDKYGAEVVVIGRPIIFSSKEDYDYWLKVELLNPVIENKDFKEFGQEVALLVLSQLSNDNEFKKVEVSVVTKTGFTITFTSKKSAFYYLDSLRQK